jgi:anti-anti-sigma factor
MPAQVLISEDSFVASGDFGMYDEQEFGNQLNEFATATRDSYVIDLTGVSFISSTCIRIVAEVMVDLSGANKSVTVRANPSIFHVLHRSGLAVIGTIEQVDGE